MNNFCGTDYGHVCRHLILLGCAGHTLFSKIMAESKFFAAGSSESESSDSGDEQPAVSKPATITTKWVKHWKKSQVWNLSNSIVPVNLKFQPTPFPLVR